MQTYYCSVGSPTDILPHSLILLQFLCKMYFYTTLTLAACLELASVQFSSTQTTAVYSISPDLYP